MSAGMLDMTTLASGVPRPRQYWCVGKKSLSPNDQVLRLEAGCVFWGLDTVTKMVVVKLVRVVCRGLVYVYSVEGGC